jgi:DNA-directed RNA polymerase subunit H (RpoH/RPB5)
MTSVSNNRILSIYKSRRTVLEIMDMYDYDVSEYNTFSINEIDAMFENGQLDMLIHNAKKQEKTYIHYFISSVASKQLRPNNLDEIIRDLFDIEAMLSKSDNLIVITEDEPNDALTAKLNYLYDHSGIFVVVHNIKRLQFNLLHHKLVPAVSVLSKEETESMKKTFNLNHVNQLPEISRYDPMALAICMRPGEVCKLIRDSPTALKYVYYRVCV